MKKDYRLYVIHMLPNLRTLDYNRITEKEREAARKLYKSKSSEKAKKKQKGVNTFVPGGELAKQQQRQQTPRLTKKDVDAIKVGFFIGISFLK
jgi:U2 small nuclear ribonucleoprotein A'